MRLSRLAAVLVLAVSCLAIPSEATAAGGSGTPVWRVPLAEPLRLAGAGRAWRLAYLSTAWNGRPTVVTGTLTLPAGRAPAGGWPVVSFGHGFAGTADACATSRTGPSPWERVLLETLLAGGYAIAVTDFEGIGLPGESSVVDGPAEAYALIDIVRAARRLAPVARSWAGVGYSVGGHAALFAGALAGGYAPELRYAGTIALAPITQWGLQLASPAFRDPAFPLNPVLPASFRTFAHTHADRYRLADWLTPTGLHLVDLAGRICVDEMASIVATLTNGDMFLDPAANADLSAELMAEEEVPVVRHPRPIRLAHGSADQLPSILTEVTYAQLAGAGNDVSYLPVPGADHFTLLPTIAPQINAWTDELFGATP